MQLRDLLFQDLWLKLTSLVAAIFIWLTVSAAIRKEVDLANYTPAAALSRTFPALPVLVVSAAADVRSFKVRPDTVDVTVRGERRLIAKLRPKDVRVVVDLTGVEAARELRKQVEVSTPPGVTYVRSEPEFVEVVVPPKH